jgi:hypothetical protein
MRFDLLTQVRVFLKLLKLIPFLLNPQMILHHPLNPRPLLLHLIPNKQLLLDLARQLLRLELILLILKQRLRPLQLSIRLPDEGLEVADHRPRGLVRNGLLFSPSEPGFPRFSS